MSGLLRLRIGAGGTVAPGHRHVARLCHDRQAYPGGRNRKSKAPEDSAPYGVASSMWTSGRANPEFRAIERASAIEFVPFYASLLIVVSGLVAVPLGLQPRSRLLLP